MTHAQALQRWQAMAPGKRAATENVLNPASQFGSALSNLPQVANLRPTVTQAPPETLGDAAMNTFVRGPMEGLKFLGHSLLGKGALPAASLTPNQINRGPSSGPGIFENLANYGIGLASGQRSTMGPFSQVFTGPIQRAMPHAERYNELTGRLGQKAIWEPVEAVKKWWNEPISVY